MGALTLDAASSGEQQGEPLVMSGPARKRVWAGSVDQAPGSSQVAEAFEGGRMELTPGSTDMTVATALSSQLSASHLPPDRATIFLALSTLEGRSFSPGDILEAVQLNADFNSALKFLTHCCPICQEQVSFSKVRDLPVASANQRAVSSANQSAASSSWIRLSADHHNDPLLLLPVPDLLHFLLFDGCPREECGAARVSSVRPPRGQRSGPGGGGHGLLQPAGHSGEASQQVETLFFSFLYKQEVTDEFVCIFRSVTSCRLKFTNCSRENSETELCRTCPTSAGVPT